jgi:hypothetical protein
MYTSIGGSLPTKECRECTDNNHCHYNSWGGWCWGKDPSLKHFDVNYPFTAPGPASNSITAYTTAPNMRVDDKRVAIYQNQGCFDCNAVEYASGMCAFASDYFPDHSFS